MDRQIFQNCVKTGVKNVDRIEGFEMAVSEENKCSPMEPEANKVIEKRKDKSNAYEFVSFQKTSRLFHDLHSVD